MQSTVQSGKLVITIDQLYNSMSWQYALHIQEIQKHLNYVQYMAVIGNCTTKDKKEWSKKKSFSTKQPTLQSELFHFFSGRGYSPIFQLSKSLCCSSGTCTVHPYGNACQFRKQ